MNLLKKDKIKEGDMVVVSDNNEFLHLIGKFGHEPRKVVRTEDVNLSYEKLFVYVMINNKEEGYYSKAVKKIN
ncbi:MAG TPA: hypothetical protein VN026_01660 [Bacteroidia bacterium]|jgi:hypothetical protein|nr:hypothetical protein [Bacteroidia bacterium]